MRKSTCFVLGILAGLLISLPAVHADGNIEWVVVVSDGLTSSQKGPAGQQLESLLIQESTPGDVIHVVSVPRHETVASVTVPNESPRRRARDRDIRAAIPKIKRAFQSGGNDYGRVNLPRLASTVSGILETEFPCRVIIFGSPIYRDPGKAGWNFTDGVVPLDGSIDYEKSPFTTASKFPDGTEVAWITLDPEWGEDKPHEDAVQHFVKLYLERQNASLIRLTPVASKALVFSPRQFTEPESINSEAVGVVSVSYSATRPKPSGNNVSVPTPGASIVSSGPERSLEAVIREGETNPNTIVIAVTWTSDDPTADVDLWVSTSGEEGELYFGNPVTDWGILYRDVQRTEDNRGGDDIRRWEYLTISHRDLDRVTLWLNAFKTNKPIEARIVRIFNGVRKERTVTLKTNQGDGGANRFHRARSAAWARVNLQTFKATDAPGGI